MNAKHTSGKWVYLPEELQESSGREWVVTTADGVWSICVCMDAPGDGTSEANARLIAAAPETAAERDRLKEINAELLEALFLAKVRIESFYTATATNAKSRDENSAIKQLALQDIRAAIAKATSQ